MVELIFLLIDHSHAFWRPEALIRGLSAPFSWGSHWTEYFIWWHRLAIRLSTNMHLLFLNISLNFFRRFFSFLLTFHVPCNSAFYMCINFFWALSDHVLLCSSLLNVSNRFADDFGLLVFFNVIVCYLWVLPQKCLSLIDGLSMTQTLCGMSCRWSNPARLSRWRDDFEFHSLFWRPFLCRTHSRWVVCSGTLEACIDIQVDALFIHLHVLNGKSY